MPQSRSILHGALQLAIALRNERTQMVNMIADDLNTTIALCRSQSTMRVGYTSTINSLQIRYGNHLEELEAVKHINQTLSSERSELLLLTVRCALEPGSDLILSPQQFATHHSNLLGFIPSHNMIM